MPYVLSPEKGTRHGGVGNSPQQENVYAEFDSAIREELQRDEMNDFQEYIPNQISGMNFAVVKARGHKKHLGMRRDDKNSFMLAEKQAKMGLLLDDEHHEEEEEEEEEERENGDIHSSAISLESSSCSSPSPNTRQNKETLREYKAYKKGSASTGSTSHKSKKSNYISHPYEENPAHKYNRIVVSPPNGGSVNEEKEDEKEKEVEELVPRIDVVYQKNKERRQQQSEPHLLMPTSQSYTGGIKRLSVPISRNKKKKSGKKIIRGNEEKDEEEEEEEEDEDVVYGIAQSTRESTRRRRRRMMMVENEAGMYFETKKRHVKSSNSMHMPRMDASEPPPVFGYLKKTLKSTRAENGKTQSSDRARSAGIYEEAGYYARRKPVCMISVPSAIDHTMGKVIAKFMVTHGYRLILAGDDFETLNSIRQKCRKIYESVRKEKLANDRIEMKERRGSKHQSNLGEFELPLILQCDYNKLVGMKEGIHRAFLTMGSIDILIVYSNQTEYGYICDESVEWMEKVEKDLNVNFMEHIKITRLVVPFIQTCARYYKRNKIEKTTAVIFVSSVASMKVFRGLSTYCSSQFGLMGFIQTLFEEVREDGIKVSAIVPDDLCIYQDKFMQKQKKGNSPHKTNKKNETRIESKNLINCHDIMRTIQFILDSPSHICPTKIVINTQARPHHARNPF